MARETTKREEDIDPEAIARWNNEGGAPGPLKRGASLRLHDAVEFEVHPSWGDNTRLPAQRCIGEIPVLAISDLLPQ
jgi:hypothetical protein